MEWCVARGWLWLLGDVMKGNGMSCGEVPAVWSSYALQLWFPAIAAHCSIISAGILCVMCVCWVMLSLPVYQVKFDFLCLDLTQPAELPQ